MWLCNNKIISANFLVCFLIQVTMANDEPWLVYSSYHEEKIVLRPLSKNGTHETHIPEINWPTALTYDLEEKKIYWSTLFPTNILRANIDGTSNEMVLNGFEFEGISGLAWDWITKNIYFADKNSGIIGTCELISQVCAALVRSSNYKPIRIALHPQSGTMVWTNRGKPDAIFKASMDGSNPTQIIAQEHPGLASIAIDHALSRLYWVDQSTATVHTSDLDGANVSTLKSIGNVSIEASCLAINEAEIYWLDEIEDSLKKCNINDGSRFAVEKSGLGLSEMTVFRFDMFLMGSGGQPSHRVNHCANHPCPYICVLTETSYRCLCPDGLISYQNGHYCEDVGPKMLISTSGGTHVLSMTTLEMKTISNSSPSWALSYDFQNSKIYWAGGNSGSTIFRSNINGSGIESVVTVPGGKAIMGLAYDWIAHNFYYMTGNHIWVCDSNWTHFALLQHDSRDPPPLGKIALCPRLGLMFRTTHREPSSITRAHMDGSSAETIEIQIDDDSDLAIDNQDSLLYRWNEPKFILTTDLDFNFVRTHFPTVKKLKSIAVGGDYLYSMNNTKIRRCNKYDCSRVDTIKEIKWNETVFKMSLFHREGQLQDRINHCAGGLCSHVCLLTQKYFRCICPTGMHLMEDARNCSEFPRHGHFSNSTSDVVSSYKQLIFKSDDDNGGRVEFRGNLNQWICTDGTVLALADICNGTLECPDGTDESPYCDIPCNKINLTDDGQDCLRTPNGPQIVCPQGFLPAADKYTCEDVDECLGNVCENDCINMNGSFECRDFPEGSDPLGVALAAAIPTIVAITLIVIAVYFGVKYIQTRKILRKLTPDEVQEFLHGDENAANIADCGADKAVLMPFRLIIQPDNITIAKDAILGSGQFGVVYRGFYEGEAVAIKTFKRTVEIDEFKAVLAEAKIMAYIGDHENVVRFIGADVSRIAERQLVLVTELSPHGDLLGYLRKIEPSKWAQQGNGTTLATVSPTNLVEWCEQIACGMQYLEAVKIVHGDLAARNVLVFKKNVVKITDFGLSKQLYGNSEYMMKRQRKLPWKWCALELLIRQEFSVDSDIWAFGVTAWEIFSLGRKPYDEHTFGTGFVQFLEQGNRLPKPTYATTGIYEILKGCWNAQRSSRPRFATLREFFNEESTKAGINNHVENWMASLVDYGYTNM